jgi:helicase-like protein
MVELHEHQRLALSRLKNGSILTGDVGSGKSLVAVAYAKEREPGKSVVVITTAKKRDSLDWDGEFIRYGQGRHDPDRHGSTLEVDSWNNLHHYVDRSNTFFIFDEQRVVGSGAWAKDFIRIAQGSGNGWLLLSATPGDTWLDYIPVFIAHGFYKHRTEFLRNHVVFTRYAKFPKVERYTAVGRLVKLRNDILVPMPFVRSTTRNVTTVLVDHDRERLERVLKDRWHVYEKRPLRDVAELFSVMRKVVNSNDSRVRTIETLLQSHPRVIVFYNFDYELDALRSLGKSSKSSSESESSTGSGTTCADETDLQLAEWNGHNHQEVPTSDRWVYLVQYQAGAEGWNCITTDTMVFYSLTYSYKNWHQAFGRIDRLNTPFTKLNYYVLMSNSVIDKAIWKALEGKKSFNERSFLSKIKDTNSQKVVSHS